MGVWRSGGMEVLRYEGGWMRMGWEDGGMRNGMMDV